jgi:hypothetical protein
MADLDPLQEYRIRGSIHRKNTNASPVKRKTFFTILIPVRDVLHRMGFIDVNNTRKSIDFEVKRCSKYM